MRERNLNMAAAVIKVISSVFIPGLYLISRRRWIEGLLFLAVSLYFASAAIIDTGSLSHLSSSGALVMLGFVYLGNFIALSAVASLRPQRFSVKSQGRKEN